MSNVYQFAIGRSRAFILAGCFAAAAVLLFFAGTLAGLLYSGHREVSTKATLAQPPLNATKATELKAPDLRPPEIPAALSTTTGSSTGDLPGTPTSASAATAQVAPLAVSAAATPGPAEAGAPAIAAVNAPTAAARQILAAHPAPAANSAASALAANSTTQNGTTPAQAPATVSVSYAVPLAVQVGSFAVKSNAETLVQSLKDRGYQPVMTDFTDAKGRRWYVVRLGPYSRWNTASLVAARVSIAENVTPVIGPMQ